MRHYNIAFVYLLALLSGLLCVNTEDVGLTTELCGDFIDQDASGADLLCPGDDKDYDGFPADQDCDDENRYVYDGISVACSCGGSEGWKKCNGNSFTECECSAPLCEATGDAKCYYVDSVNGNNDNPGTFSQPWASYLKFVSYYTENLDAVKLSDGDFVYFIPGSYASTYTYDSATKGLFLRGVNPTVPITLKAYPNGMVTLQANGVAAIEFLQSSNIVIEGFEVTAPSYGSGISISEVTNITIRNCWVHDIDGVDNNNIAGIHMLTSYNGHVHHNRINDNYDRTNADTGGGKTENSRNMVLFNGGNNRILHNIVYQTKSPLDPVTGGCITYKHRGDDDKGFEVAYNYFWNCAFQAVGSGTANSHVHHNLIINSQLAFSFKDHGGTTSLFGSLLEYNTLVATTGLVYIPVDTYGTAIGSLTYSNNIIVANTEEYNTLHPTWEDKPVIRINRYGSDEDFDKTVPFLTFNDNCYIYYSNDNEDSFDLFSLGESKGAAYNFTEWQAEGFDTNSFLADPVLDPFFVATAPSCKSKGYATFASGGNPSSPSSGTTPSMPAALTPSKPGASPAAVTLASGVYLVALFVL